MTAHNILFNAIVDREDESRTTSPGLGMQSSRSPVMSPSMSRMSHAYWGGDHSLPPTERNIARDYPYSQYRTEIPSPLEGSANPTRSSKEAYGPQAESPNPTIDFSGLIPMYGDPGSPDMNSRGHLIDLSYDHEWPSSNMAQYDSFQRNKAQLWPSLPSGSASSTHWNSSFSGAGSMSQHLHEYVPSPPSPYSSASSSSPSPTYFLPPPSTSTIPTTPASSRRGAADQGAAKKSCFHCHVTSTPLWRREPSTQRPLCNACGLYLQQRNKLRPQALIDADIDDDDTPQIPDEEYTGPKCSHCLTRQTSVWRRSKTGAQVCNACGVYARLRGKERPLSLRRNKIKPRTKHSR
ncbi:hypothetical protein B0H17DRAFT_1109717 [Mycena rosella]|uniref:GATA-type domain-containing protein n=1 Tax=Mycena rosella TaxID=1033263 RepID=A0AAD7BT02_MYCRO|nr:hypothetical protein B0H17DRAFT_1109717 [Mycena rosella]